MASEDGFTVDENPGSAEAPLTFIWSGGKRGYLWIGDADEQCVLTLSAAQSRKLARLIQAHASDE